MFSFGQKEVIQRDFLLMERHRKLTTTDTIDIIPLIADLRRNMIHQNITSRMQIGAYMIDVK